MSKTLGVITLFSCYDSQCRHINQKTGKVNTDHQYKGIRWYFATDPI